MIKIKETELSVKLMRKYIKQVQYTEKLEQLVNVASSVIDVYDELLKGATPREDENLHEVTNKLVLIVELLSEFEKQHEDVVKSRP